MLLHDFLIKSAELRPEKEALICDDKRLTYRQIDEASNSLGNALISLGFKRSDRAIIYLDNSAESVISIFAILKAGGIFVPISPQVKINKLGYIINNCQPCLLITSEEKLRKIAGDISNFKDLKLIFTVNTSSVDTTALYSNTATKILSYRGILLDSPHTALEEHCIDVDLASLIYTSGSSGNPKGVMLSHLNMVSAAKSITQYLENTSDDIIINPLPLSFDYGLYQVLMSFYFGGTVIIEKSFTYPQKIINWVITEKVTGWPMMPTMIAILIRLKNLKKHNFSSLRYITSTGQALPKAHLFMLRDLFPNVRIYPMYGLTECKRVSYLEPEKIGDKPNSVGKAMPNVEAYIVDDDGREVKQIGVPGELVVRGSNVMQGYWNLPHETRRVLRSGRFLGEKILYTGDMFEKDEEDDLYFLGRKDDIIKTSGFMVSPKEVENVLCQIEDIIEAAVVGIDDEILGKSIKAFIRLKANSIISEDEIIEYCTNHLEQHAVPRSISFRRSLPKTSTGKIRKQDLT
jgi:amino acid adenylation domain-containing protein